MSTIEEIGEIVDTNHKMCFEWVIKDFFAYTETNLQYSSPNYYALNSVWKIRIWPNGRLTTNSVESVSLYLYRMEGKTPETIDFKFSIKTVKHPENEKDASWKNIDNKGLGYHHFIERSKLEHEKNHLVPSGNLTIICTLIVKDNGDTYNICAKKFVTDFKDMFTSKKNTDVTIKVKEFFFSAHKFILVARSPVLAAMFENEMIEKKTGFVEISDCDPEAFNHFLLYLYSGQVDFETCDFYDLYEIADKYDMPELKLMCTDFIIRNISVENVCETYVFGIQFSESELLTCTQNFFNENFEEIISSDNFLPLMKDNCELANDLLKGKVKIEK